MAETTTREEVMRKITTKIADSSLRTSLLAKCGNISNVDYFRAIFSLSLQEGEFASIFSEWLEDRKQEFRVVQPKDISSELLNLLQNFTSSVPDKDHLTTFLVQQPPVKFPVSSVNYGFMVQQVPRIELDKLFYISQTEHCHNLGMSLLGRIICQPFYSENSSIHMLDNIIYNTLRVMLPTALYNRKLSTESKHPDSVLKLNSIPIFCGQESLIDSIADLQAEIPLWEYPDVPYFLGYYSNGANVTFIYFDNTTAAIAISSTFNLVLLADRLSVFRILVNIASILPGLVAKSR